MIIKSQNVQLDSSQVVVNHHERTETLDAWKNGTRVHMSTSAEEGKTQVTVNSSSSDMDISGEGMRARLKSLALKSAQMKPFVDFPKTASKTYDEDEDLPLTLRLAKKLLEKLFGINIDVVNPYGGSSGESVPSDQAQSADAEQQQVQQTEQAQMTQEQQIQQAAKELEISDAKLSERPVSGEGWGIRYTYHEVNVDKEAVSFSASGEITTEDGRKITFNANLEMSKEQVKEVRIEFKAGDALIDPLALNFDGRGVRLTDEKVAFDLNSDGKTENVSFVQQGSGYLALDKNNNGAVDNGSELFGPQSNHGFLELKAYDQDQNNWIDENDAVYGQLRIWTKNENGEDVLSSLKEYNVGAIYLDNAQTLFGLSGGQLRETGIYLKENGEANFIQEVDLAT
ncbi:MAG: hypothetical protein ACM3SY_07525 [Candidatus Omnitrophota bacterium]